MRENADRDLAATKYAELEDNDAELERLFSAFDEISATSELKSATIAAILGNAAGADAPSANACEESKSAPTAFTTKTDKDRQGSADPSRPIAPASASIDRSNRGHMRARLRAIRMAALAACLALALTGGVAYAVPASRVTVSQGEASVDLGINMFGITVSAEAAGDDGDWVDVGQLKNLSGEDAMDRAAAMLGERHDAQPIDVSVVSGFEDQAQRFEERGVQIERDHEQRMREFANDATGFEDVHTGESDAPSENPADGAPGWDERPDSQDNPDDNMPGEGVEGTPGWEESPDDKSEPGGAPDERAESQSLPDAEGIPADPDNADRSSRTESEEATGSASPTQPAERDNAELQDRDQPTRNVGNTASPTEESDATASASPETPDAIPGNTSPTPSATPSATPERTDAETREASYEDSDSDEIDAIGSTGDFDAGSDFDDSNAPDASGAADDSGISNASAKDDGGALKDTRTSKSAHNAFRGQTSGESHESDDSEAAIPDER